MQMKTSERGSTFQKMTGGLSALLLMGAGATVNAGEVATIEPVAPTNSGDWCSSYKNIGKLYSNPSNPWIQEFNVVGRFQYQLAYVDGQVNGNRDFSYHTDEVRRFYAGANAKVLKYLKLSGQANIYDDDGPVGGSEGFEFEHMWDLFALVDLKGALGLDGFDALSIGYGAREVNMSNEWNTSSKNIKTVERSAVSNKIWAFDSEFSNPTGAWLEGQNGNLGWTLGAFTTTQDDWLAPWDDGVLYYSKFAYDFSSSTGADISKLLWTYFYQDVDPGDEVLAGGLEWASSLSVNYGNGPWELMIEGIYGDNGAQGNPEREGSFWGAVVMPSYWISKEKLEAVFRYQYEGSDNEQGIRVYSRYSRRADARESLGMVNGGRGDEHHSAYAGLNYYLCGHNAKFMAGVQYDNISSGGDDVYEGWTGMFAFRTFF